MASSIGDFIIELGFDPSTVIRGLEQIEQTIRGIGNQFNETFNEPRRPRNNTEQMAEQFTRFGRRIDDARERFESFTNGLHENVRASDRFSQRYGELREQFSRLREEITANRGSLANHRETFRQYRLNVQEFQREMRTLNRTFTQQNFAVTSLSHSLRNLARSYASVFVAVEGLRNLVKISTDLQALEASFIGVTGNAKSAAAELDFLADEADRIGISFHTAAGGYKNLLAATQEKLGIEGSRELITGIMEASRVMQLSEDDTKGVIRALSQMASKGQVMAEELKGQIGERLSPAVRLFSEAIGVSTQELFKMMEQGQVIATDTLPLFAKRLREFSAPGMKAATSTLAAEFSRLNNAVAGRGGMVDIISKSGFMEGFTKFIKTLNKLIKDSRRGWEVFGKVLGDVFKVLAQLLAIFGKLFVAIGDILDDLEDFNMLIVAGTVAMTAFALATKKAGAAVGFLLAAMKKFFIIGGVIAIVEEFMNIFREGDDKKRGFLSAPEGFKTGFEILVEAIPKLLVKLKEKFVEWGEDLKQWAIDIGKSIGEAFADGFKQGIGDIVTKLIPGGSADPDAFNRVMTERAVKEANELFQKRARFEELLQRPDLGASRGSLMTAMQNVNKQLFDIKVEVTSDNLTSDAETALVNQITNIIGDSFPTTAAAQ